MYPTLIRIGPITISSFGFFMTLAFLGASFLVWRESKREYLDEEAVLDVFMLVVALVIVGARISFILLHPALFGMNILRWLLPTWVPGFYFYGGMIFGMAAALVFTERKKIGFPRFLDTTIIGVLFAAASYKIGQWLDGSLVGFETTSFFGLPVVGESGRFAPVALFEGVSFLVIFALLVKMRNYFIVQRKIAGALFLSGVGFAAFAEILAFFLMRDIVYLGSIPISLAISVSALVVSVTMLYRKTRSLKKDLKILRSRFISVEKIFRSKIR